MTYKTFYRGQQVRNVKNGWLGTVFRVECLACGDILTVEGEFTCPHKSRNVSLVIQQGGFLKPFCLPEHYEPLPPPTAWERLVGPDEI